MTSIDEKYEQIKTAASWNEEDGSAYKSFQDLMKKRKEIANAFLREVDPEKKEQMGEMISYINKNIRAVLGL